MALAHKVPNPAVEDFTLHLQNRILEALDHIYRSQETLAKTLEQGMLKYSPSGVDLPVPSRQTKGRLQTGCSRLQPGFLFVEQSSYHTHRT